VTRSHATAAGFQTPARFCDSFTSDFAGWRSTVLWVLERRRAQSSCSVCCEGWFEESRWEWEWVTEWYDWRRPGARPLSRSAVFFTTPWHCRGLSNERYADHIQFKYWLLRRLMPGITDRSPLALRRQQFVSSLSSTTPCHDASAALRLLLVASSVFWVTFSVVYYVIDSFSCLLVSISFRRCIEP